MYWIIFALNTYSTSKLCLSHDMCKHFVFFIFSPAFYPSKKNGSSSNICNIQCRILPTFVVGNSRIATVTA